jgi:integrase/recombinase XerD
MEVVRHAQPRAWLSEGALVPLTIKYQAFLEQRRYAPQTRHIYLCCVAHFAHWLASVGQPTMQVDKAVIDRFLEEHLPQCTCSRPVRRVQRDHRSALRLLLRLLQDGAQPPPIDETDYIGQELRRFDLYMMQVKGLAPSTRRRRVRFVARFLGEQFGARPIVAQQIKATDLRRFMIARHQNWSAGSRNLIAEALRCYIRFRALLGDPVQHLAFAIPPIANWRLATLPRSLSESDIVRFLRSFDRAASSGKRAYAMARCLTDLGLRANEVARLRLEDIDWYNGTIRLAGNKSRRTDVLPLPLETGRAIAVYLTTERPTTANRAVFVRHVAPYDDPIGPGVVRKVVIAAFRRCGWSHSHVHILRHSAASRLLAANTPLKEIADILRHRNLDTTAIYTKVDMNRLAAVALPWPGSAA